MPNPALIITFFLDLSRMSEKLTQVESQSLLSMVVPVITCSLVGTAIWAMIHIVKKDQKKARYKMIPGTKGMFYDGKSIICN